MTKDQLILSILTEIGCKSIDDWYDMGVSEQCGPYDSVAMGGCIGCGYTTNVEPDQREGWCEECETNTVVSIHSLLGVI